MDKRYERKLFCKECKEHVSVFWPFESFNKCCDRCGGDTEYRVCYYDYKKRDYVTK